MTSAIIFIPAAFHFATYAAQCLTYCAGRGYEVYGIVTTDWAAVLAVLSAGAAQVVVVARPDHLDPDRVPRIEVADPATPYHDNSHAASARDRRTQVIRRNAAK